MNLETLEIRGIKSDLILTYKIINNLIDIDQNTIFIINPCLEKYNLRRHESHLRTKTIAHSSIRQQFFSHRTINIWNKLPNEVIKAKSLPIFKTKLNCLDLSKFYISKLKLWDFCSFFFFYFFFLFLFTVPWRLICVNCDTLFTSNFQVLLDLIFS